MKVPSRLQKDFLARKSSQLHEPVLLAEVLALIPAEARLAIDGTIGGAGHAEAILQKLGSAGQLIGFDRDRDAIEMSRHRLSAFSNHVELFHDSYANLDRQLGSQRLNSADFALLDLGLSSYQFEQSKRGFSFQNPEEPLDLRFNCDEGEPLSVRLSKSSADELTGVLREFGEVERARPLAREIIATSVQGRLRTAGELSDVVMHQFRGGKRKQLLAQVWQALRIWVNDELTQVQNGLEKMIAYLGPGGVLAVISFHSLEDRIVKGFFVKQENPCVCPKGFPTCVCGAKPTLERINRKAIKPTEAEIEMNPRARSARLRAAKKLAAK